MKKVNKKQVKGENIKQASYLNAITSWIDSIANIGIALFLNPVIMNVLGATYYGIWQILVQMTTYMATTDFRSSTTIKWVLSRDRTTKSDEELRESTSTAFFSNILVLPLYVLIGSVIIYISPYITKVDEENFFLIRSTSLLLVISFIVTQFFFIFESILQGMNITYKRIGVRAAIRMIGAALTYYVLIIGYGMIGMAIVQIFVIGVVGLVFWQIVKRNVSWFKIIKVGWDKIVNFIKLTGWFMLDKFSTLLNQSVDLLLLGYFANATYVAHYTISRYVFWALSGLITQGISSIMTSMTKYIKENKLNKIYQIRHSIIVLNWVVLSAVGSVVVFYNQSFVGIWIGLGNFVGHTENLLIIFWIILRTLSLIDVSILVMNLDLKKRIRISVLSSIIIIILSIILIPVYELTGLLIALISGTLVQIIFNSYIVSRILKRKVPFSDLLLSRASTTGIFFLILYSYLSQFVLLINWFELILYSTVMFPFTLFFIFIFGVNKGDKNIIISNLKSIKLFRLR